MAKDHDNETIHPPPQKKGKKRLAVDASNKIQSDTKRVEFDYDKYAEFLKDTDLSDAEKLELCKAVWNIMSEFVMLGFGVHPIQQACGQPELSAPKPDLESSYLIQSDLKHLIEEFDDVAECRAPDAREGVSV